MKKEGERGIARRVHVMSCNLPMLVSSHPGQYLLSSDDGKCRLALMQVQELSRNRQALQAALSTLLIHEG